MKISEALEKAWALIDSPEKWTREAYARNASGRSLDVTTEGLTWGNTPDNVPVCFCSRGAIRYACKDEILSAEVEVSLARAVMQGVDRYEGILNFNDDHPYEEVKEAWQLAIELAKKEGQIAIESEKENTNESHQAATD